MINIHILAGAEEDKEILIDTILNEQEDISISGMLRWYVEEVEHVAVILDDEDQGTFNEIAKEFEDDEEAV